MSVLPFSIGKGASEGAEIGGEGARPRLGPTFSGVLVNVAPLIPPVAVPLLCLSCPSSSTSAKRRLAGLLPTPSSSFSSI